MCDENVGNLTHYYRTLSSDIFPFSVRLEVIFVTSMLVFSIVKLSLQFTIQVKQIVSDLQ